MSAPRPVNRRLIAVAIAAAALAFPLGAVANHQFTDVPASNTFHNDIDALRDAGVTTGCAAGKFCPKDFVTREQMAAFLNRLGALAPDKTPVVNATKVDGYDAGSLSRVAHSKTISSVAITSGGTVYGELMITAPTAGFVLVTTVTTLRNEGCTVDCNVYSYIDHVGANSSSSFSNTTTPTGALYTNIGATAVFDVAAGPNTFNVVLIREPVSNGVIKGYWGLQSAYFSPFAGGGFVRSGEGGASIDGSKR